MNRINNYTLDIKKWCVCVYVAIVSYCLDLSSHGVGQDTVV